MPNNLLDGQEFLVDIVDEMQGVVEWHSMQINYMWPLFYKINKHIDLIDQIAAGARKLIMGFAGKLDEYYIQIKTIAELARRLDIAEEKILEQAEELARRMDTGPDHSSKQMLAIQHTMSAIQTEDAPTSNAIYHESSAVQTEVTVGGEAETPAVDMTQRLATADAISTMASSYIPPPPPPLHPSVMLQPPTPQTSQEEVVQMILLEVPVEVSHKSASTSGTEEPELRRSPCHHSPSPMLLTEPRRSPCLRSPSPLPSSFPSKQPADSGDEGPAKRRREE